MKLRHCLLALLVLSLLVQVPAAASPTGTSLSGFGDDDDDDDDDDDGDDDDGDDDSSDANEAVDELLSDINDGYDAYQKGQDLMDQWESLDAREADCGSNYQADAGPTVPSQCAESEDCMRCYGDAVRAIDFNRFYIERARCITAANVRMANSAMAFGDSSSGVHGVMGLSWSLGGKPQIEQAVADLKRTYTRKANDYLFEIDRSMKKLGQCEAEHFGERDWYQRYGWLYVNFMRSKYGTAPE
jgi:hypothetical protein